MATKLKIEKRGDEIKKKSSPLKLLSQSQPNFAEMIWVFPFQNCVAEHNLDADPGSAFSLMVC
jgi:hypothetical protein